jgi:hypothetical protein
MIADEWTRLAGFLTARFTSHQVLEGMNSEIEELYVEPQSQRFLIDSGFVKQAVSYLRQQGALTIHARI